MLNNRAIDETMYRETRIFRAHNAQQIRALKCFINEMLGKSLLSVFNKVARRIVPVKVAPMTTIYSVIVRALALYIVV